ncbi:reverse transcriptase domain-containing protein [Tanacetum coccineum]|uniref:Reverse transcriptase domain-containing protein n=1 Tax=Tanacetum coccineum TaxID=301880 RepID=A0ABQ5C5H7_9ASTR
MTMTSTVALFPDPSSNERKNFMITIFPPWEWEIARDAELNPFKDVIVFRKMVEFLGAILINIKGNMWDSEECALSLDKLAMPPHLHNKFRMGVAIANGCRGYYKPGTRAWVRRGSRKIRIPINMYPCIVEERLTIKLVKGEEIVTQVTNNVNNGNNNNNNGINNKNKNGNGGNNGCSYKGFQACDPKEYDRKGGAIALTRWIEKMESVIDNSGCTENQKVRYAASSFVNKALVWWNTQIQARGREATIGMTWNDFKALLVEEFCPSNEMERLENEFWNHIIIEANHAAYTDRFHELAKLVPHLNAILRADILTDEAISCSTLSKSNEKRKAVEETGKSGRSISLEGDEILRVQDLVPRATPVVKSPYRVAPSEMQELYEQLQELQDKVLELLRKEKLYAKFTLREIGRVKLRRVRAMSITIQSGVKDKILATSSETPKVENAPAEMLRDMDQQMEKRADDGKANVVTDALSRKEQVKPRRVRAMAMTIQYGVRGMILAAQSEAFKQENILAERLHGLDQQMERKEEESLYFMDRI